MSTRPDYPTEHHQSAQEKYGQESNQPEPDYPTLDQQLDHLDTSEFHRHLAHQLVQRLLEELPQDHSVRERTFSGRKLSIERQDHSGNLWPSQTWLLNEDPHTNAVSPLNIQDYHRHLLRSATNKEELTQSYHRVDSGLANLDQLLDARKDHAAQQAVSFHSAATDLLDSQPDPAARREAAAVFAQLVTNPALEALRDISPPESLTHPEEVRRAIQDGLADGTLSSSRTALMFQSLQDTLDHAEKVQSLRSPDPHTMYTVADRRHEENSQNHSLHHRTLGQEHHPQALNDAIARDLARYQEQERTPYHGDPTTRHLYDPATVQLLRWAIDHDELGQWAEAPLTHQSEAEIQQTVQEIADWTDRTISDLSQPPQSLDGPVARWASARGLASQWLQHYGEQLATLEQQDPTPADLPPPAETDAEWSQRYDHVMNLPEETPHLALRQETVQNILQLRGYARRYPL